jgi:hypothetical protein
MIEDVDFHDDCRLKEVNWGEENEWRGRQPMASRSADRPSGAFKHTGVAPAREKADPPDLWLLTTPAYER